MKTKTLQAIITLSILLLFFGTAGFSAETTETEPIPTYEEVKKKTQELKTKIMELQTRLNEIRFKLGKEPKHYVMPQKMIITENDKMIYKHATFAPDMIFKGKDYYTGTIKNLINLMTQINHETRRRINHYRECFERLNYYMLIHIRKILRKMSEDFNNYLSASEANRDRASHILLNFELKKVLAKITEDLNDAETDYNRRVDYKNSNTAMFFISPNIYIIGDKSGAGFSFAFNFKFAYFFKSSSLTKIGFFINAEINTLAVYPNASTNQDYGYPVYADLSFYFAVRSYKFYLGAGIFFGKLVKTYKSPYFNITNPESLCTGLSIITGLLLTRHIFIGLTLKIYLKTIMDVNYLSIDEYYRSFSAKPVLIGFEAGVYF